MRQVFLFFSLILFFILVYLFNHPIYLLIPNTEEIQVQFIYQEQVEILSLKPYTRLIEALEKLEWLNFTDVDYNRLNLNEILKDRDSIRLPLINKKTCISINYADSSELELIPGIGPKTAQNIIEFREQYGLFRSLDEIMSVKGIGIKKFESIEEYICL